jgi:hypothetical protein
MPVEYKPTITPYDGRTNPRWWLAGFGLVLAFLSVQDDRYQDELRGMLLLAAHLTGAAAVWFMSQQQIHGGNMPFATLAAFNNNNNNYTAKIHTHSYELSPQHPVGLIPPKPDTPIGIRATPRFLGLGHPLVSLVAISIYIHIL